MWHPASCKLTSYKQPRNQVTCSTMWWMHSESTELVQELKVKWHIILTSKVCTTGAMSGVATGITCSWNMRVGNWNWRSILCPMLLVLWPTSCLSACMCILQGLCFLMIAQDKGSSQYGWSCLAVWACCRPLSTLWSVSSRRNPAGMKKRVIRQTMQTGPEAALKVSSPFSYLSGSFSAATGCLDTIMCGEMGVIVHRWVATASATQFPTCSPTSYWSWSTSRAASSACAAAACSLSLLWQQLQPRMQLNFELDILRSQSLHCVAVKLLITVYFVSKWTLPVHVRMLTRRLYKVIHTGWELNQYDFGFNVVQLLSGDVNDLCIAGLAKEWNQPPLAPSNNLCLF